MLCASNDGLAIGEIFKKVVLCTSAINFLSQSQPRFRKVRMNFGIAQSSIFVHLRVIAGIGDDMK